MSIGNRGLRWFGGVVAIALFGAMAARPVRSQDTRPTSAPTSQPSDVSPLVNYVAVDIDGVTHRLGGASAARPFALVFLGTECPIAQKSVPKLNRIATRAAELGIDFFGVLSDPTTHRADAAKWRTEFALGFDVLFDASGEIAVRAQPTHTPEAFVYDRRGALVYRGRIDDGFVDIGKPRAVVGATDLADALDAVAAGRAPAVKATTPVGCIFEAWKDGELPATPTFARDIAPIVETRCVACHRTGEIAPFTLGDYESVSKRAEQIARVVAKRVMPPWKVIHDHGTFFDESRLSDREIALFDAWAKAGAPQGDAAELPPTQKVEGEWRLGKPDLVLEMSEPFEVPAEGRDVFRCFVLPTGLTENREVVGVEFKAGAPRVVHHSIYFLDKTGRARKLDERDPGPGYAAFGGIGFVPTGALGGFAPGAEPHRLTDGLGFKLDAGTDIVMQLHYHPSGKVEHDRSRIAIYFAKEPIKRAVVGMALTSMDIAIPPGVKNYRREASLVLPCEIELHLITPHMHQLGREMSVMATLPNGESRPLVVVDDWDFRWQGQYLFRETVKLPAGTRLDLAARYDNSADNPENPNDPPKLVRLGEATTDEMCFCFMSISTNTVADYTAIQGAMAKMVFEQMRNGGNRRREKR